MSDGSSRLDPDAVREHLLGHRRGTVEATVECAGCVAAAWPGAETTDRERVVDPLRAALSEAGLLGAYPSVLVECVAAAGGELRAEPVAAPPYVTVTSVGPVLRATLDGGRLVVTLGVFDVEREAGDGRPRYVRGVATPEAAVRVEVR
ncbi:MAG: hypothetical protein V5A62_04340 [Haloarculaceae archaeon]